MGMHLVQHRSCRLDVVVVLQLKFDLLYKFIMSQGLEFGGVGLSRPVNSLCTLQTHTRTHAYTHTHNAAM